MKEEHSYKNYKEVVSILTTKYGFKYSGTGDNAEECFYKDSDRPETIFVHTMFCSYYKASSREIFAERLHPFEARSDHKDGQSQATAFQKLLIHLDGVRIGEHIVPTKWDIEQCLVFLEEKKSELKVMAVNPLIAIESKKLIPKIYANVLSYQNVLKETFLLVK